MFSPGRCFGVKRWPACTMLSKMDFAEHSPRRSGVKSRLGFAPLDGGNRCGQMTAPVDLGSHDRRYQEAEIVTAGNKLIGQVVESLGMARWIVVAEVIDRVDEASTDQFRPDAVDDGSEKKRLRGSVTRSANCLRSLLDRYISPSRSIFLTSALASSATSSGSEASRPFLGPSIRSSTLVPTLEALALASAARRSRSSLNRARCLFGTVGSIEFERERRLASRHACLWPCPRAAT